MSTQLRGSTQLKPLSVTNAEIATAAAIAYAKLNLTGAVVNADIVSLAYSKLTGVPAVATEFTTTTTGNIDDLNFANASTIRLNNATLATIRGLLAGTPGQRVTIVSVGAGQVNLAHANGGSAAANQLLNAVTSGVTPLAAGKGSATYVYDGASSRWRLVAHYQGAPIAIPYSAGLFTGSGTITWTVDAGDVVALSYEVVNNFLIMSVVLATTSVSGAGTDLRVALPNSYTSSSVLLGIARVNDNGAGFAAGVVYATLSPLDTTLNFETISGANWAAATNATAIQASLMFPLN